MADFWNMEELTGSHPQTKTRLTGIEEYPTEEFQTVGYDVFRNIDDSSVEAGETNLRAVKGVNVTGTYDNNAYTSFTSQPDANDVFILPNELLDSGQLTDEDLLLLECYRRDSSQLRTRRVQFKNRLSVVLPVTFAITLLLVLAVIKLKSWKGENKPGKKVVGELPKGIEGKTGKEILQRPGVKEKKPYKEVEEVPKKKAKEELGGEIIDETIKEKMKDLGMKVEEETSREDVEVEEPDRQREESPGKIKMEEPAKIQVEVPKVLPIVSQLIQDKEAKLEGERAVGQDKGKTVEPIKTMLYPSATAAYIQTLINKLHEVANDPSENGTICGPKSVVNWKRSVIGATTLTNLEEGSLDAMIAKTFMELGLFENSIQHSVSNIHSGKTKIEQVYSYLVALTQRQAHIVKSVYAMSYDVYSFEKNRFSKMLASFGVVIETRRKLLMKILEKKQGKSVDRQELANLKQNLNDQFASLMELRRGGNMRYFPPFALALLSAANPYYILTEDDMRQ